MIYKKIKVECYGTVIRGGEDTSEDQLASVCDNEFGVLLAHRFNDYERLEKENADLRAINKG